MSDFKIVKCKSCDAALVELTGQKLTSCVQCGYQFGLNTKSRLISNTQSSRRRNRQRENKQLERGYVKSSPTQTTTHRETSQYDFGASSSKQNTPELSQQIERLKRIKSNKVNQSDQPISTQIERLRKLKNHAKSQTTNSMPPSGTRPKRKKAKYIPPKKKSNPIGTIIFLIIAFNVLRSFFSS